MDYDCKLEQYNKKIMEIIKNMKFDGIEQQPTAEVNACITTIEQEIQKEEPQE